MKRVRWIWLLAAGSVALAAAGCTPDTAGPNRQSGGPAFSVASGAGTSYLIVGSNNALPPNLGRRLAQAGGSLTATVPQIGLALAVSSDPTFAAKATKIAGLQGVAQDPLVPWIDPSEQMAQAQDLEVGQGVVGEGIGDDEPFFGYQWAPKAIHAPQGWALGAEGAGVRVAVVDGGLNPNHVDLAPNVDVAHSASFVPGYAFDTDTLAGGFWHAVHVAGIIAAAHNGVGTIGVAPAATIVGVKVLQGGSGSFGQVIQGIVYAATSINAGGAGANIINMSLGATLPLQQSGAALLAVALGRATSYAYQQGVTVIASAGNDGLDLDHTANVVTLPAMSPHVIAVSATGPVGFVEGATNFTQPATYTNYGHSVISFAAPGGNDAFCPSSGPNSACVLDWVLAPGSGSPVNNGYYFAEGTSMAAPHVAGIAALIIGQHGGALAPSRVEAILRGSADDLGKVGDDDFYGRGFVNAYAAVR